MKFTGSQLNPISFLLDGTSFLCEYATTIKYHGLDIHECITVTICVRENNWITDLKFLNSNKPDGITLVKDYPYTLRDKEVTLDFGTDYLTKATCVDIQFINFQEMDITFICKEQVKKDATTDESKYQFGGAFFPQSYTRINPKDYTPAHLAPSPLDDLPPYPTPNCFIKTNATKDDATLKAESDTIRALRKIFGFPPECSDIELELLRQNIPMMKCCIEGTTQPEAESQPSCKDDAMFWDLLSYGVGSLRGDGKFLSMPLRLSGSDFLRFKLRLSDDTIHTLSGKYFPNHPDIKDDDIVKVSIAELTKEELILEIISIDSKKDEPLDDVALMLKSLDKRLSCWHKEYKELLDRYTNLLKKVGK